MKCCTDNLLFSVGAKINKWRWRCLEQCAKCRQGHFLKAARRLTTSKRRCKTFSTNRQNLYQRNGNIQTDTFYRSWGDIQAHFDIQREFSNERKLFFTIILTYLVFLLEWIVYSEPHPQNEDASENQNCGHLHDKSIENQDVTKGSLSWG